MDHDRLSILPDPILCHILSFLLTEDAVATSILSKRWKSLWRSVPALDCHNFLRTPERFVQFVYAAILYRDLQQPIHKFKLTGDFCNDPVDPGNVVVWVNTAVPRRLQHLDISLECSTGRVLTRPANLSSVFSCTTLVVLKLRGFKLEQFSYVDLPSLKVLHLVSLSFSTWESFVEIFSGCPALEDLEVFRLCFDNDVTDREFKTLPKLYRADITISPHTYFLLEVVNNVKVLHLYEIVKLLQRCPMLQDLVIKQPECHWFSFRQLEERGDWKFPPSVPQCVLLHLKSCYLDDYIGTPDEFRFARYIMRNGRFLKKMAIHSYAEVKRRERLKNFKKLSSCTRRSTTCRLSFK